MTPLNFYNVYGFTPPSSPQTTCLYCFRTGSRSAQRTDSSAFRLSRRCICPPVPRLSWQQPAGYRLPCQWCILCRLTRPVQTESSGRTGQIRLSPPHRLLFLCLLHSYYALSRGSSKNSDIVTFMALHSISIVTTLS